MYSTSNFVANKVEIHADFHFAFLIFIICIGFLFPHKKYSNMGKAFLMFVALCFSDKLANVHN